LTEKEGTKDGNFLNFSIISVMQWFEGDIKITITSAIYFST